MTRGITLTLSLLSCGSLSAAMPSAPPGQVEAGTPAFAVMSQETLGLSSLPTDMQLLPDGRVLVVSARELVLGDGTRWETFQPAGDHPPLLSSVAVDHDGRIYTSIAGGFARIELDEKARWQAIPVAKLPETPGSGYQVLLSVTTIDGQWYWYGGGDAVISWRPGQAVREITRLGTVAHIFKLGEDVFASDESSGRLFQLNADQRMDPVDTVEALVSETVTSVVDWSRQEVLVGTGGAGLKYFDGRIMRPFDPPGGWSPGARITDLCPVGDDFFAASIAGSGLIIFNRDGRTVQSLNRSLDHRLSRIQRLHYSPLGVLWMLMNDGVARVEFPSALSYFAPLLESDLTYAHPLRHVGKLWILADGRAMRGVYDPDGRLEGFVDDSPPGRFLFTLTDVAGRLFGSNDRGIFVREPTGWRLALPGIVNARIGVARAIDDEIYYVARGEYGVIRPDGPDYHVDRIPQPALGDSYNVEVDRTGVGWLEMGVSQVAQFVPNHGNPQLRFHSLRNELADQWVEIYQLDGIVRFQSFSRHFRFDEPTGTFIEDVELTTRFPDLLMAQGRPATDSLGQVWFTSNGEVKRLSSVPSSPAPLKTIGFAPTSYIMEDDGVVWMFQSHRLVRFDQRVALPPPQSVQALITSVQLSAGNRRIYPNAGALGDLDHAENSLMIYFAAPANPFTGALTFEVKLEGAGGPWTSTGAVGSATFDRLKEGDYVFRVRPILNGRTLGLEDQLRFTVRPPWFRTPLAWILYGIGILGFLGFVIWFSTSLHRRKNERLERLVTERTGKLFTTNALLARQIEETTSRSAALVESEDRYRLLNAELERRVEQRTDELRQEIEERKHMQLELADYHQKLLVSTRQAGMAEVATGVLHNVGNVLNSVNVSATLVSETLHASQIKVLGRVAELMQSRADDLDTFLTTDPKGRLIPRLVIQLASQLAQEHKLLLAENEHLGNNVQHIKEIVSMQQGYAKLSGALEQVILTDLTDNALRMHADEFESLGITVVRDYAAAPPMAVDRHMVIQILVNLLHNAKYALIESGRADPQIRVQIGLHATDRVRVSLTDNGAGIEKANLTRIFFHGFTTRPDGHGFGLHSGANAAKQMGGSLTADSPGPNCGATFTLELPLVPKGASHA